MVALLGEDVAGASPLLARPLAATWVALLLLLLHHTTPEIPDRSGQSLAEPLKRITTPTEQLLLVRTMKA